MISTRGSNTSLISRNPEFYGFFQGGGSLFFFLGHIHVGTIPQTNCLLQIVVWVLQQAHFGSPKIQFCEGWATSWDEFIWMAVSGGIMTQW